MMTKDRAFQIATDVVYFNDDCNYNSRWETALEIANLAEELLHANKTGDDGWLKIYYDVLNELIEEVEDDNPDYADEIRELIEQLNEWKEY